MLTILYHAFANTEDTTIISVTYVWHRMGWTVKYTIKGFLYSDWLVQKLIENALLISDLICCCQYNKELVPLDFKIFWIVSNCMMYQSRESGVSGFEMKCMRKNEDQKYFKNPLNKMDVLYTQQTKYNGLQAV